LATLYGVANFPELLLVFKQVIVAKDFDLELAFDYDRCANLNEVTENACVADVFDAT
jgi:hypothetical protein